MKIMICVEFFSFRNPAFFSHVAIRIINFPPTPRSFPFFTKLLFLYQTFVWFSKDVILSTTSFHENAFPTKNLPKPKINIDVKRVGKKGLA